MITQNYIPLFLTFISSFFTPSPAEWNRKTVLGYSDDEIIYMEIKRSAPGSYFNYVDSAFIVSRDPSDEKGIDRRLVRATWHEDSTSMGDWMQNELYRDTLDLNRYMSEKSMHYTFSSSRPWIGQLKFQEYGLLLNHKDIGRLLLSKEKIEDQSKVLSQIMTSEKLKIVAKHDTKDFLLLTIETGQNNLDSDFKQFILAVPMEELSDAEKTFRQLNR